MSVSVEQPRAGVAVLIRHENKLLLSRRSNMPEQDSWQCAGGYLLPAENVFDCAMRCAAETGVHINQLQAGPYTNNVFDKQVLHSITLYVLAQYSDGVAHPDWHWFDWQQLPQPLFLPLRLLLADNTEWLADKMSVASRKPGKTT